MATPTDVYKPLFQNLEAQRLAERQRYAENAGDIKNIFGTLTTVSATDRARIENQFAQSIEQQQQALAARTAEARMGSAAGQAGAATAGAETGLADMPAPTSSRTQQIAEAGIADANAQQGIWENLMRGTSQQTLADLENRAGSAGYQEANALMQLDRQNTLAERGFDAQKAQLTSQQLQSQMEAQQAQAKLAQDWAIARMKASGGGGGKTKSSGAGTLIDWENKVAQQSGNPKIANVLQSEINAAFSGALSNENAKRMTKDAMGRTALKQGMKYADKLGADQIYNAWKARATLVGNYSPEAGKLAYEYITNYFSGTDK